jgi:hypothetical protein
MSKKSKSTEKEAPKGTAKQQLEELQYKTGLTSAVIKDKLRGLGEDTFGAPTLTSSRGKLTRGPLAVASFDEGGEAKKDPVGVAAKLLNTFNEYGKKAEEFGLKARDFMVENMISPTDIATMVLKVKRMVPAGALTYSGGLNEGEDEQIAKMREAARQQQPQLPQRFAQGGMSAPAQYPDMPAGLTYGGEQTYYDDEGTLRTAPPIFKDASGRNVYYNPAVAFSAGYGTSEGDVPGTAAREAQYYYDEGWNEEPGPLTRIYVPPAPATPAPTISAPATPDRKSTRLNSSHT